MHATAATAVLASNSPGSGRSSSRRIDESLVLGAHLEIVFGQKAGLARGVAHEDPAFLVTLDKALVVASDTIAHIYKVEFFLVKDVTVFGGKFQQMFREAFVVQLLLEGVVERGVAKIILAVKNKKLFELLKTKRKESS
jgi:hypothetical protein